MRIQTLYRRLSGLSIQTKMNVLIIGLLGLPFFIFGLLWFQKSTETIETNARQYNQELIRQTGGHLDSYFRDLERSTFPLVSHPLIQQFMSLSPTDTFELVKIKSAIEQELLPNFFFGRTDIYGFSIVSRNGISTNYGNAGRIFAAELLDELKDDETYKVMGLRLDGSTPVVTVIRKFWDTQAYQTAGFIIIDLNMTPFSRIVSNIKLGQTGHLSIIDSEGKIVEHTDPALWGKAIPEEELATLRSQTEGYYEKKTEQDTMLVMFHRSALNDWIIVSEVPLRELAGKLIAMRNISLWVGSCLIVFVLLVLGAFSLHLTRSLQLLQRLMYRAENGELNVLAPEKRYDEIGRLNRSFNKMVGEIRRLIEVVHASELKEKELELRQKEAMLLAMQSQINPHFLYNTLEAINSYAVVEGVLPISNMTTALADLFRYSVGDPKEAVTLEEELRHLSSYFEIQKERYRSLEVDIRTDEHVLPCVRAVRLIVQPIVENAFTHGYEKHKLKPSYIGLHGEVRDNGYVLSVVDKGKGMPPERKAGYDRLFAGNPDAGGGAEYERGSSPQGSDGASSAAQPAAGRGRIGLSNVHQRIRLVFGEPYGITIRQSGETGTRVDILLPFLARPARSGDGIGGAREKSGKDG
ncbi:MAG: signal protein [Paenibacillus sp.]|nr:signal protein [Paenibacillus sp.]